MEVETARNTCSTMNNSVKVLLDLIITINSSAAELQGAWIGNSATEYFGEVQQWTSRANQLVEQLAQLTSRLDSEVNEWEQMASKLA